MKPRNKRQPLEEKYYYDWNLKSADAIYNKLFENQDHVHLKDLLDGERLVIFSYALGKVSSKRDIGLKTSQIRPFYESLLTIKNKFTLKTFLSRQDENIKSLISDILHLKPLLAYRYKRNKKQLELFFNIVNNLIDTIKDLKDFEKFLQFIEAVVAYHKYCGGRD